MEHFTCPTDITAILSPGPTARLFETFLKFDSLDLKENEIHETVCYQYMCVCVCVYIYILNIDTGIFLAPVVKNPPANAGDIRDTGLIPGLGRSQEEEMTTHSSILAWRILGKRRRSLVGYSPQGCAESDRTKVLCTHVACIFQRVLECILA